jgi:hypothetical protein
MRILATSTDLPPTPGRRQGLAGWLPAIPVGADAGVLVWELIA